jgi:hypothetical protein
LTLLSQVTFAGGGPGPMTQLGTVLFVDNGEVEACLLGFSDAVCKLSARLPNNEVAESGIGVL